MTTVRYSDGSERHLPETSAMAQVRREYLEGRIDVTEYERCVEILLRREAPDFERDDAIRAQWRADLDRMRDGRT